jgi:enamine deaminase RidA (YjgF/YER057c/UK114 family)
MKINVRTIEGKIGVFETYITAVGAADMPFAQQAEELFSAVANVLKSKNAKIFQERVFGTEEIFDVIRPIRVKAYGFLNDMVDPTWLIAPKGINGEIAGVQVHAIGGNCQIEILRCENKPCGRIVQLPDHRKHLALNGISAAQKGDNTSQASKMFEKAESVLKQAGADMFSVARTWMWLKDILAWYDQFNGVRNQFFMEKGLISKGSIKKMPASTGIGIYPANGGICAMDLISVFGPGSVIEYLDVTNAQKSAYDYGSAFSRVAKTATAAGQTVFVSGTASIDAKGATIHIGDAEAQIRATIENVRTALKEMGCCDDNVVQAIIYCKTAEIEKLFCSKWSNLSWPHFTVIADVCRDDLLFEIEATAVVGS